MTPATAVAWSAGGARRVSASYSPRPLGKRQLTSFPRLRAVIKRVGVGGGLDGRVLAREVITFADM